MVDRQICTSVFVLGGMGKKVSSLANVIHLFEDSAVCVSILYVCLWVDGELEVNLR